MQKDTAINRGLQNLSARYNYIYNANILLNNYQENLDQTYKDNYHQLLAIYTAPPLIGYVNDAPSGELDSIARKAQTIISEKNYSNYIASSYLLLGKTGFYKGNYYTAAAYFDYVERTYKSDKNIYLNALNWKARTYLQLNNYDKTAELLDSVKTLLDSVKRGKAEPLATLAQFNLTIKDYPKAIIYLAQAIKESKTLQSRTRWPYILAQLYEQNENYKESLRYYTKVERSNAPFEMYFNAKLSEIRINDLLAEHGFNRKQELLNLLKDDKNYDYTDQIYFEVAQDYFANQDYKNAEEYYSLSAQKSTNNQNQKGLAYLKIADLNFKELNNDSRAKLYYDSAVNTLPKDYPNYEQILKKAQNLTYLTERYQIIAAQDSLQYMAKLPPQMRSEKLASMFDPKIKEISKDIATAQKQGTANVGSSIGLQTKGGFYFNNQTAIGRGFNDFKRRWGNRALEDNWRQSVKSSAQLNQQNLANITSNNVPLSNDPINTQLTSKDKAAQIKAYTDLLPLSLEQMEKSDQQIINAYFEIATFYQQVLVDQPEAIKAYETLLARYPQNEHLEAIYYSLYLGYMGIDDQKATDYKNLVLTKYPASSYAKTILDPSFSVKQSALDLEINNIYNHIFESYEKKDYPMVISTVKETNQRFPSNSLQVQFDYLKAIAIGRTENLDSLLTAFHKITVQYPGDSLIVPLIKDHLAYIDTHLAAFKQRKIALIDFDPLEPRFTSERSAIAPISAPIPEKPKNVTQLSIPAIVTPTITAQVNTTPMQGPADSFFSLADSKLYYFVVDVTRTNVSVSSSRFGIGQFNRGNYTGQDLKHQLIDLEEDQLIYIGNFDNLNSVRAYAENLILQLPKVMKIPAGNYRSFFISKENFDKIKNRDTINQYLEFYKNNYSHQ
ncbi:MAG: gliding motility protein [Bacteroidota bacterium]